MTHGIQLNNRCARYDASELDELKVEIPLTPELGVQRSRGV